MSYKNIENSSLQFTQPWTSADSYSQKRIRVELTRNNFAVNLDKRSKSRFVQLINKIGSLIEPFFKKLGQLLKDWKKEDWKQGQRSLQRVGIDYVGFKDPEIISKIEKIVLGLPQDNLDKINKFLFEKISALATPKPLPRPSRTLDQRVEVIPPNVINPQVVEVEAPVAPVAHEVTSQAVVGSEETSSIPDAVVEGEESTASTDSEESTGSEGEVSDNEVSIGSPVIEEVSSEGAQVSISADVPVIKEVLDEEGSIQDMPLATNETERPTVENTVNVSIDASKTRSSKSSKEVTGRGNLIKGAVAIAGLVLAGWVGVTYAIPFARNLLSKGGDQGGCDHSQDSDDVCYPHEQFAGYSSSMEYGLNWSQKQAEKKPNSPFATLVNQNAASSLSVNSWTPQFCYTNETVAQEGDKFASLGTFDNQPYSLTDSWKAFYPNATKNVVFSNRSSEETSCPFEQGGYSSQNNFQLVVGTNSPFATLVNQNAASSLSAHSWTHEICYPNETVTQEGDEFASQYTDGICCPHEKLAEEFYARYSASIQHGFDWSQMKAEGQVSRDQTGIKTLSPTSSPSQTSVIPGPTALSAMKSSTPPPTNGAEGVSGTAMATGGVVGMLGLGLLAGAVQMSKKSDALQVDPANEVGVAQNTLLTKKQRKEAGKKQRREEKLIKAENKVRSTLAEAEQFNQEAASLEEEIAKLEKSLPDLRKALEDAGSSLDQNSQPVPGRQAAKLTEKARSRLRKEITKLNTDISEHEKALNDKKPLAVELRERASKQLSNHLSAKSEVAELTKT